MSYKNKSTSWITCKCGIRFLFFFVTNWCIHLKNIFHPRLLKALKYCHSGLLEIFNLYQDLRLWNLLFTNMPSQGVHYTFKQYHVNNWKLNNTKEIYETMQSRITCQLKNLVEQNLVCKDIYKHMNIRIFSILFILSRQLAWPEVFWEMWIKGEESLLQA